LLIVQFFADTVIEGAPPILVFAWVGVLHVEVTATERGFSRANSTSRVRNGSSLRLLW
jgi:hypothetical protein